MSFRQGKMIAQHGREYITAVNLKIEGAFKVDFPAATLLYLPGQRFSAFC
jgi:hypothetical protein